MSDQRPPVNDTSRHDKPQPLLTGTPGRERRDGATVDLAQYEDDPEYRAMIDARAGRAGRHDKPPRPGSEANYASAQRGRAAPPVECGQPTVLGGAERPCQMKPGHGGPHMRKPIPLDQMRGHRDDGDDTSRHEPPASLADRLKASLEAAAGRHDKPALPADAVTAAAKVIHSLTCGECDYHPDDLTVVSSVDREDATKVLEAAYEAIRDQATAAERARIRQLAIRNQATCTSDEGTGCYFADLLDADL
jgi:hypothetical protein